MKNNIFLEEYNHIIKQNPFLSASELVYESLLSMIVNRKIACGIAVSQSEIADQFNLSRTPVRDAMNRLVEEGYLEKKGGGFQVYQFNPKNYEALVSFRSLLELSAVKMAVYNATEQEINEMKNLIILFEESVASDDMANALDADSRFHFLIVKASRNSYLIETYHRYLTKINFYRNILSVNQNTASTIRLHREVFEAICNRDAAAAEKSLGQHLEISKYIANTL